MGTEQTRVPTARPGRAGKPAFLDALDEILRGCRRMLAPDGYLVITARAYPSMAR